MKLMHVDKLVYMLLKIVASSLKVVFEILKIFVEISSAPTQY